LQNVKILTGLKPFIIFALYFTCMSTPTENLNNQTDPKKDSKAPIRVMLADDDKDDQHLFEEALDKTNVPTELTTANNGQELMDNLHDTSIPNPDVIFLDINMPVKNGKDCLKEIKADEDLKDIPTVIYSTSDNEKDINETFKAGANLYVSKPNSFSRIVSVLKYIFTLRWHKLFTRPDKKDFVVSEKSVPK